MIPSGCVRTHAWVWLGVGEPPKMKFKGVTGLAEVVQDWCCMESASTPAQTHI